MSKDENQDVPINGLFSHKRAWLKQQNIKDESFAAEMQSAPTYALKHESLCWEWKNDLHNTRKYIASLDCYLINYNVTFNLLKLQIFFPNFLQVNSAKIFHIKLHPRVVASIIDWKKSAVTNRN